MSNLNMDWQQDGLTVYALNEQGVNDFSFHVQGNGRSGYDPKKLTKVASMALAAPDMYRALLDCIAECEQFMPIEVLHNAQEALAKADGGE